MRRAFALFSIVFHAVLITAILVTQLFAIGTVPTPRRSLDFETPAFIKTIDIPLPAPERRPAPTLADQPAVSANAAPVVAPEGVTQETGRENAGPHAPDAGWVTGNPGAGLGTLLGDGVPPPPPPPPPREIAPMRVNFGGIAAPVKVVDVAPKYPAIAQSAHVEGVVILEVVIDARGQVESVRVLRSIPLLDQAAIGAVHQWRFTSARLNGDAVPVVMTVTVNFTLRDR